VNKENIFEELNKMRKLIHTKPGVVISEQIILSERDAVAGTDDDLISISQLLNSPIDTTQKQINSIAPSFSNRKSVIFKSPNNTTYVFFRFKPGGYWNPQNFVLKISGQQKTFGTFDLQNIYFKDPSTPENLWAQDSGFNTIVPIASIKGSDTPAAPAASAEGTRTPEAINNINANFCSVRDGKINTGGAWKGKLWTSYKETYKVTDAEEQAAKQSCPKAANVGNSGSGSGQSVNSRFSKSVESIGIQGGKMDLQTLQSILKMLEGGQSTTASTQGTPDLAQLTAALNQLNA
jgi:hypothetical protein